MHQIHYLNCAPLNTVGIHQIQNNTFNISTYPNPVSDKFQIANYQSMPDDKVELLNILGETIKLTPYQNTIDISSMQNGIYFLKIISSGQIFVSKIVKH